MENEKRKKKDLEDRQRRELEKFKQREDGTYYFTFSKYTSEA